MKEEKMKKQIQDIKGFESQLNELERSWKSITGSTVIKREIDAIRGFMKQELRDMRTELCKIQGN